MGVFSMKAVVMFSFTRTLVICDNITAMSNGSDGFEFKSSNPGGIEHLGNWSGSNFCQNKSIVTDRTQILKSATDFISTSSQILVLPVMGFISDNIGRKPTILLSSFALFLQYLLLALASIIANLRIEFFPVLLLFLQALLQGFVNAFIPIVLSMVADRDGSVPATEGNHMSSGEREIGNGKRGKVFGLLQGLKSIAAVVGGGMATFLILTKNLGDYSGTMFVLSILSIVSLAMSCFFPETHVNDKSYQSLTDDEERRSHTDNPRERRRWRNFIPLLLESVTTLRDTYQMIWNSKPLRLVTIGASENYTE
eukprot:g753.t1